MIQLRDEILADLRHLMPPELEQLWQQPELSLFSAEQRAPLVRQKIMSDMQDICLDERNPNRHEYGIIRQPVVVQVLEEWLSEKVKQEARQ